MARLCQCVNCGDIPPPRLRRMVVVVNVGIVVPERLNYPASPSFPSQVDTGHLDTFALH